MNHKPSTYKALVISESSDGNFQRMILEKPISELPPGDILIRVHFSALNYKDALSATGNKGITKKYPHTPGIDAAGVIEWSNDPNLKVGAEVIVTGYDLGMNTSGGFSSYINVPANWVIPKPSSLSLKDCMTIGTAGLTAATALHKMIALGVQSSDGPIAVTGATGGVGSWALLLLHQKQFSTIAISGKRNATDYLKEIGADEIWPREKANDESGKLLLKPQWAGAIDTVGGNILNTLLRSCKSEGVVASTGLAGSPALHTTVFPFILNGISLVGVGSAEMPLDIKKKMWNDFQNIPNLTALCMKIRQECSLQTLMDEKIDAMLEGKTMGRTVVDLRSL